MILWNIYNVKNVFDVIAITSVEALPEDNGKRLCYVNWMVQYDELLSINDYGGLGRLNDYVSSKLVLHPAVLSDRVLFKKINILSNGVGAFPPFLPSQWNDDILNFQSVFP